LGGNKGGTWFTYRNLLLTFLIGGFWHGAGWGFVFWGAMHGVGLTIHRVWSNYKIDIPRPIAWTITMLYVDFLGCFLGRRV
jgi:D-alanyl-lipoteichoic acid acyltransferase DltB (MBOAT superfamily)